MAQQTSAARTRIKSGRTEPIAAPESLAVPDITVRLGGALLALAVATAHVTDQGGVTAFTAPDWLGWAYRLIEIGGVLTALTLLWPRSARLGWGAGVLLGVAPMLGYLASRTVGVPGDSGDVGNWDDWVGTLSLVIEAGLVTLSLGMLWTWLRSTFGTRDFEEDPEIAAALPHGWDPA